MSALEIEALMREERIDEAYDRLLDLVKKEPLNAHGWYLLGTIYRRHGMWMEAIEAFSHSKIIEPTGTKSCTAATAAIPEAKTRPGRAAPSRSATTSSTASTA